MVRMCPETGRFEWNRSHPQVVRGCSGVTDRKGKQVKQWQK